MVSVHNGKMLDGPYKGQEHGWPYDECRLTKDGNLTTFRWSPEERGWRVVSLPREVKHDGT
jgi:hypothetical protein